MAASRYRDFAPGTALPSTWTDALEDVFANYLSSNFKLEKATATTIQIAAAAGDGRVEAMVDGKPRWITANATATHPGGGAGTYDIYLISTADSFGTDVNGHETDTTTHSFGLKIVTSGGTPSGSGSEARYRKIGTLAWDGSAITSVTPVVGLIPTDTSGLQPLDADLTAIAALPSAADKLLYSTGAQAWSLATLTAFARTILDDIDAPTARATLGIADAVLPVSAAPILDVGVSGQRRAGRVLTLADFTTLLGASTPIAIWNLSDLTDVSGNARTLSNKGTVTFGKGIMGAATEAAIFTGSTAQALWIADTGANDPFRIKTGSWFAAFRTAKRGTTQMILTKEASTGASADTWFELAVTSANVVRASLANVSVSGITDVADDRWHFAYGTYDGSMLRVYVDFVLEASIPVAGVMGAGTVGPLNIGGYGADGSTAAGQPFYGRIDEAGVTPDVFNEDQIRLLGAQKIAHGLTTTPREARVNVRRRVRGPILAVGDFTTTPQFLLNGDVFSTTTFASLGSLAPTMTNSAGGVLQAAGPDGKTNGAYIFTSAGHVLTASDTGLPSGTAARTMGIWFRTIFTGTQTLMIYGTDAGPFSLIGVDVGTVRFNDGTTSTASPSASYNDGAWHFLVAVIDNAAIDLQKVKLYADGKFVAGATTLASIATLGGAAGLRLGQRSGGAPQQFLGGMGRGFITNYAMTQDEISNLYAKGSLVLGASPKNSGDHVELFDATNIYYLFDTLDSQHQIDLGVAA